jgi:trans-2,3-dihydro-3-hydroxyanthranilate isomerase
MNHRLYIVDVFAEQAYAGNPLAVVVGPETLSDDTMQRIAAEINYSETTFVAPGPESDGGYRMRIYTPAREIDFAGHPLLGTAWVLRHYVLNGATGTVALNLSIGQVPVTFEDSRDGREVVWFLAPPAEFGAICAHEAMAAALGIAPGDLDAALPVQQVSAGTAAMMVPLRSLAALERSQLDLDQYAPLAARGFPPLTYLFTRETYHVDNDLCVRFFFDAHGVREDPATGNGAAFLGAYLLHQGVFENAGFSLRIEQGYAVRRPSLVMLHGRMADGNAEVRVGGHVMPIVQGELLAP